MKMRLEIGGRWKMLVERCPADAVRLLQSFLFVTSSIFVFYRL